MFLVADVHSPGRPGREIAMTESLDKKKFEEAAAQDRTSFLGELWSFIWNNKKWWLAPIIIVLLLLSALIIVGGTGAAPFIYTLF